MFSASAMIQVPMAKYQDGYKNIYSVIYRKNGQRISADTDEGLHTKG